MCRWYCIFDIYEMIFLRARGRDVSWARATMGRAWREFILR